MVYEHFSRCFILEDPSLGFSKLFQIIVVVAHGDIFRLVALMLRVSKLLAMEKDLGGLCPIVVPLSFSLRGHFKNTYPPINSKYQPQWDVTPSFLTLEPSLTYILIGS
jgi:hypothetical protein